MARKPARKPTESKRPELTMPIEKAKSMLQERIGIGRELIRTQTGTQRPQTGIQRLQTGIQQPQINIQKEFVATNWEFTNWDSYNTDLLMQMFTTDKLVKNYKLSGSTINITSQYLSPDEKITNLYEKIDKKITSIEFVIDLLNSFN
ncbi:MAG: hypothetical protein HQK89_07530 [Nitrospirae bacterium]|nr:hypothetical protein [Nitrospirota bacterium]